MNTTAVYIPRSSYRDFDGLRDANGLHEPKQVLGDDEARDTPGTHETREKTYRTDEAQETRRTDEAREIQEVAGASWTFVESGARGDWRRAFGERKDHYVKTVLRIFDEDELWTLAREVETHPPRARGGAFVRLLKSLPWTSLDRPFPEGWDDLPETSAKRWERSAKSVFDVVYVASGECEFQRARDKWRRKRRTKK